jgi:hypothetical protein
MFPICAQVKVPELGNTRVLVVDAGLPLGNATKQNSTLRRCCPGRRQKAYRHNLTADLASDPRFFMHKDISASMTSATGFLLPSPMFRRDQA